VGIGSAVMAIATAATAMNARCVVSSRAG